MPGRIWGGVFGVGIVLGWAGCSSGSQSPSGLGSSYSGSCQSSCDKIASLGCANEIPAECVPDCESTAGSGQSQCPSEVSSYLGCLQQLPQQCGPDGTAELVGGIDVIFERCGPEASAFGGCTACNPDPDGDDPCDACRKSSCCTEWKAIVSDPDVLRVSDCLESCDDATCLDGCFTQYPAVKQKYDALTACQTSQCPACS
jgi:hypothetical protein